MKPHETVTAYENTDKPWEIWKPHTPSHWEIHKAEETEKPQVYEHENDKVVVFHATLGGHKVIVCDFCQKWVRKIEHSEQYKKHIQGTQCQSLTAHGGWTWAQ